MSRGAVVQWHWNFGDGAESKEQNPVHVFDQEWGLMMFASTSSPPTAAEAVFAIPCMWALYPYCSLTGTVVDYTGLDGCGLLIQA